MKRTVLIAAVAALCVAGSAVAQDRSGQYFGSGGRAEDGGQIVGSGGYLGSGNAAGQTVGSGGFLGSGTQSEDGSPIFGSGGYLIGDGRGGYFGSGLSILQFRLSDGSSLLVVSSDEGTFFILIEE